MSRFADRPEAIEEPYRLWEDVLDEHRIPPGHYDLSFRLPWPDPVGDRWRCMGFLLIVSLLSLLVTPLLQYVAGTWVANRMCLAGVYGLAILATIVRALTLLPQRPAFGELLAHVWPTLLGPLAVWAALVAVRVTTSQVGAAVYLALVGLPAAILVGDRLSTHALFWSTASAWIELPTLLSAREAWQARFHMGAPANPDEAEQFAGPSFARLVRWYPGGIAAATTAMMIPVAVWLSVTGSQTMHLRHTVVLSAFVCGLVAAVAIQHRGHGLSVRRWTNSLVHWLQYEVESEAPPWLFRPPAGPPLYRQISLAAGFLLFAPAALGLTGWCAFFPPEIVWEPLARWQLGLPMPTGSLALAAIQAAGCVLLPMILFLGVVYAVSFRPISLFDERFE